jgi:hypothetical protein
MIIREVLEGDAGKRIRDDLLVLIKQLDMAVLQAARDSSSPDAEVSYRVGCADGVRFALQHVMDLGKQKVT